MKSLTRAQDKAELLARLGNLTPESERRWGQMNVQQMVCHLADACRMALGQKPVSDDTSLLNERRSSGSRSTPHCSGGRGS